MHSKKPYYKRLVTTEKLEPGLFKKLGHGFASQLGSEDRLLWCCHEGSVRYGREIEAREGECGKSLPSREGLWVGVGMCCLSLTSRGQHGVYVEAL